MSSKLRFIFLWSIIMLISGCGIFDKKADIKPGSFKLKMISSPAMITQIANDPLDSQNSAAIDLGDIPNTTVFYFALMNTGESEIVNISLSTDHHGYIIAPKHIDALSPLDPLALSLTVQHGTAPSGVGPSPLLEPGSGLVQLNLQGETLNEVEDLMDVQLEVDLLSTIQLADLSILSNNTEVNLTSPRFRSLGCITPNGCPSYNVFGDLKFKNSGNTDLDITLYGWENNSATFLFSHELVPSEEYLFPSVDQPDHRLILEINPRNVITDHKRLPIRQDGRIYLILD